MVPRKAGGSPEQGSWSSLSSVCAERQCGGAGGSGHQQKCGMRSRAGTAQRGGQISHQEEL